MRDQTEWVELVEKGANVLTGADEKKIVDAVKCNLGRIVEDENQMYGGGRASYYIANRLAADAQ